MIFLFPVTMCIYINTECWPEHSFNFHHLFIKKGGIKENSEIFSNLK